MKKEQGLGLLSNKLCSYIGKTATTRVADQMLKMAGEATRHGPCARRYEPRTLDAASPMRSISMSDAYPPSLPAPARLHCLTANNAPAG
jgi:hypothetical protein